MVGDPRKTIISKIKAKQWFKKTDKEIKEQLIGLSDEFLSFLKDLAERPEEIGSIKVRKMIKLAIANFLVVPLFEVESKQTLEKFTYEYVSWKYGKHTGSKGLIFLSVNKQIKYVVFRRKDRFPAGIPNMIESLGSFYSTAAIYDPKMMFSKKVEVQIKKLLNIQEINIKQLIDLGSVYPDSGLSNELIDLFAAVIDISEDQEHGILKFKNTYKTITNTVYEIDVWPIDQLDRLVNMSSDSQFLACVCRLLNSKIISLS